MPWIYVPEVASEAPSGEASADERCATWRTILTANNFSKRGCETEALMRPQCGMICGPSRGDPGGELQRSCSQASPVSPGVWRAGSRERPTNVIFGPTSGECFARYDPDSRSWKMFQASLFGGLAEYSETWPRAGIQRNGMCYRLQGLERRTGGRGSGLWPTPKASIDGTSEKTLEMVRNRTAEASLMRVVLMPDQWPTPRGTPGGPDYARADRDGSGGDDLSQGKGMNPKARSIALSTLVEKFPTPSASVIEPKSSVTKLAGRTPADPQVGLADRVGGQLNPEWVEWLMGWPCGCLSASAKSASPLSPR